MSFLDIFSLKGHFFQSTTKSIHKETSTFVRCFCFKSSKKSWIYFLCLSTQNFNNQLPWFSHHYKFCFLLFVTLEFVSFWCLSSLQNAFRRTLKFSMLRPIRTLRVALRVVRWKCSIERKGFLYDLLLFLILCMIKIM